MTRYGSLGQNSLPLEDQLLRWLRRPSDRHLHFPSPPALKVVPLYPQLVGGGCGCSEIDCSEEGRCRSVFGFEAEVGVGFEAELDGDFDMKYELTDYLKYWLPTRLYGHSCTACCRYSVEVRYW